MLRNASWAREERSACLAPCMSSHINLRSPYNFIPKAAHASSGRKWGHPGLLLLCSKSSPNTQLGSCLFNSVSEEARTLSGAARLKRQMCFAYLALDGLGMNQSSCSPYKWDQPPHRPLEADVRKWGDESSASKSKMSLGRKAAMMEEEH